MSIRKFYIAWIGCLLFSIQAFTRDLSPFRQAEDSILSLSGLIKNSTDDRLIIRYSENIASIFRNILTKSNSYSYGFDTLKFIGKVESPDHVFRFVNWNVPLNDGTYRYFGFLQVYNKKENSVRLFELKDQYNEIKLPENSVLSAGKWYGALYYKILRNKVQQHIYYTLLALRYNDVFTSGKIIEVMYFDEYGNPVFGAPLFNENNQTKLRIVFQYSARVAMNLTWDDNVKMIVFDHLEPSDPKYAGKFEYYGPDLTFDGFQFKKNQWQFRPNLDLRRNGTE